MQKIEDLLKETVVEARKRLLNLSTEQAVAKAPGKEDTLALDAVPEQVIIDRLRFRGTIITEEAGVVPKGAKISQSNLVYFVDPIDMSKQLRQFLEQYKSDTNGKAITVREALEHKLSHDFNSALISVSAVQDGSILANVMMNVESGNLYLVSAGTIEIYSVAKDKAGNERIKLRPTPRFVATTVGGSEKPHYYNNIARLGLQGIAKHVEEGPHRILYLTDRYGHEDVGCILSNGEKITEWIGWFAYLKYIGGLAAVELYQEKPESKSGVPLSITPDESIFKHGSLDLSVLDSYENPAGYRSLIALMPESNLSALESLFRKKETEFREIKL